MVESCCHYSPSIATFLHSVVNGQNPICVLVKCCITCHSHWLIAANIMDGHISIALSSMRPDMGLRCTLTCRQLVVISSRNSYKLYVDTTGILVTVDLSLYSFFNFLK